MRNYKPRTPAGISRRQVIGTAAVAMAAPLVVPGSALGKNGSVAPSERIVMAGVGIGNRGTSDVNWAMGESDVQFVAICDVRQDRRDAIKALIDKKYGTNDCAQYHDYREFFATRTDIDAVVIATSERWHAAMGVAAMRAGKDVYSEKPACMTIADGRVLADTARRSGRVYQSGTQRRSEANFIFCNEVAQSGRLGKIHTVYAHMYGGSLTHDWLPAEPEPPKEELDWDMWLGPIPWRPYNKRYTRGGWHGQYDMHTGSVGEWGSHTVSQCQMGINSDDTSAIEYSSAPKQDGDGLITTFPNGIKCIFALKGWRGSCGVKYEGTEGWVSCADGYAAPDLSNRALLADFKKLVNDYTARTQRPIGHMRDFLNCVRSRRVTVSSAETAHRTMTTCHAANISIWLGRPLKWDPVKEEFINDAEANRLRSRAAREPYQI